jgi:Arc/MetJ-type ribon-helix-helix transcriptional regulator
MQITLTKPQLQQFVEQLVRAGRFASPAEVVEAGLARLMLDPTDDVVVDERTLAAIDEAQAQIARGGEDRDFEEFAAEFHVRRRLSEAQLLGGVTPDMTGPELRSKSIGKEAI